MQHHSTANSRLPSGLLAVVILLGLGAGIAGCDRAPQQPPPVPAATVAPSVAALPVPSATEDKKRGETANANDEPMKSMTKAEESTSMPQPGQTNDHSTLANDSKK